MRFPDAIRTAVRGLLAAKFRSFLTILGIVIGIASVILLMFISKSAEELIVRQVEGIGSNLIFVLPGATKGSRFASPPSLQGVVTKTLVERDVEALRREPSIAGVAPAVGGQARVSYGNNDTTVTYNGVTAEFFEVRNFGVAHGAAFTERDVQSFQRVAVLGTEISKTLFGTADPVGKTIRLKGMTLRVTGVLEPKGIGPGGVDQDNLILVPLTVAQKQLLGVNYYSVVSIEGSGDYASEFIRGRVITILRQNHRIPDPAKDDFTIRTQEDALSLLGNITSVLTIFLTSIAAISLLVGGIGIMNIMLVSVVERTREIGLRKAVGATNRDILEQFLIEAVMLTAAGGLAGILLGSLLTAAAALILSQTLPTGWTFSLPPSAIGLAAGVSIATGLVFGLYPARTASRKNPIDALRYE